MEYYGPPENYVELDNLIASSFWALGVCSCVGLVCNHKNNIPIKVEPCEHYDYDEKKSYYKIEVKDKMKLEKLKKDLNDMKRVIKTLEEEIEEDEIEQFNNEHKIETVIPYYIKYKFGSGVVRLKENDKYYHGMTVHDKKKYMKEFNHRFFERIDDKKINWVLGTKDHNEYCCNCSFDQDNSKRRTVYDVYQCNGHVLDL